VKKIKDKHLTPSGPVPSWLQASWLPWLPAVVGLMVYINTLGHDYALDDAIVITENMFTQDGLSGIPGLLKYDTFYGFFKEAGKAQLVAGGRYRPLTPVMFAVERSLFGNTPLAGHLLNALFYALLCALLFLTLRQLLLPGHGPQAAAWVSLFAALLFAVHPLHTEAVANIKGRDEIITFLGCLTAWWVVLRAQDERKPYLVAVGAGALFLALMAKEHAIAFLAVIPLSLWFFRPGVAPRSYFRLWPLLLAALAFLVIRGSVIGWQMGAAPMEMLNNPFIKVEGNAYLPFSVSERWGTILFTLLLYLKLLVWPWPLTHDYYPRHIPVMDFSHPWVWLSLALHLGLLVLILRGLRHRSPYAFAGLFYLATLALMSNILFPVGTTMSERFLFIPSAGFTLALALAGERYFRRQGRPLVQYLFLGLTALWAFTTVQRNPVWKDNYTLFLTDVHTSVNSAKLQNAAGGELIAQAVSPAFEAQREEMLRRAVTHLEKALAIHPAYKNACLLLGNAHNYLREYDTAVQWYQRALTLDPNYREAQTNLHITYRDAGRYYGETRGDLARSLSFLEMAQQLQPRDFETLRLLGIANGIAGKHADAARFFNLALEVMPENADLMAYLGNAYMHLGLLTEAQQWHTRAEEREPGILDRLGIPRNR
jgi:protein O-mannosyl-transferase